MADTVDEVADELFAGTREDFTATRTERAAEARAAGDRDLAKRITALRKPTVAAWVVNQIVRRHPEDMAVLADLADELGAAQRHGSGDRLRTAMHQRRELLGRLDARAREIGGQLTADVAGLVATTFQAALVDGRALHEVLAGRLSTPVAADPNAIDQWQSDGRRPPPAPAARKSTAARDRAVAAVTDAVADREQAEQALTAAQEAASVTDESLAEARAKLERAQTAQHEARDAVTAAKRALTDATNAEQRAESALAELDD